MSTTVRDALAKAAQSLEAIATQAGRYDFMEGLPDIRAYARNRALVARAALAQSEAQPVAWIPVAESMPSSGVTVLASYTNRPGNVRCIRACWVKAKNLESSPDSEIGEYDEESDCCYDPEGWYEQIDNWGDYSSVAVVEGEITHWMPLPAPPAAPPQQAQPADRIAKRIAELEKERDAFLAEDAQQAQPVAWRDHVEQRLLTWRQRTMNRSGDHLALDDFMDKKSLDDLIDFVCDEWAGPAASPQQAQPAEPAYVPLSEFQRMRIIGDEFPIALVQPIIIQKIDAVCLAIERAVRGQT